MRGLDGEEGVEVKVLISAEDRHAELLSDVRNGLSASPKSLPPNWFYDERGSELFEEITRLEEYYPTRTEASILQSSAAEIVERSGADVLVELGSGVSEKTRLLLDEMAAARSLQGFVPLDVSEVPLRVAANEVHLKYGIPVTAVVGDFRRHLGEIPIAGRRLVCFLGGTIGNFQPAARRRFLVDLEATMAYTDRLLLGTDLVKERERLLRAYDDSSGVTASFNKNLLGVLNREVGATFDLGDFKHVARWNEEQQWIEMWLRAERSQRIEIAAIDEVVTFEAGEEMLTEISAKFTSERIAGELAAANFVVEAQYLDPAGDFLLTLAHPYC